MSESEEEQYQVKDIVDHHHKDKLVEVKVKWVGYDSDQDSWEPLGSLLENAGTDVPTMIRAYFEKCGLVMYRKQNG